MPNRRWLWSLTQQDPTGWYRMTNALQTWYHLWKSNDKHGHRTSESTYSTRNRSMCKHLIAIQNHGRAGWTQLVCQQPVRVEAYWYWVSVHASFFCAQELHNFIGESYPMTYWSVCPLFAHSHLLVPLHWNEVVWSKFCIQLQTYLYWCMYIINMQYMI